LSSRKSKERKINKIWVAMGTPFQANFFAPLIREMGKEYEVVVTARDHDRITSILDAKKIDYQTVGKHGGRTLSNKLEVYAKNIQELLPVIEKEKPDLLLTERWPEAVRVAFGLNIPSWGIFYDEREKHVNQMVFPLLTKVFSPRFYTIQELHHHGVMDPEKVVWFNGFHTCYLKSESQDSANPYTKIGVKSPVVFVRPEPELASFFPNSQPILEHAVGAILKSGKANVVVLPRTEAQRRTYTRMGATIMDDSVIDSPVVHADVTLGAAETMLMESLVLGKPTVSSIYWELSKPVIELHRYIRHSTDPKTVAGYVMNYVENDEEKAAFKERAALIVRSMDDPVQLMIDEIRRLESTPEEVSLSSRRRSHLEIYLDIISAVAVRPLRLTHVMKVANVSYNELKRIIDTLESRSLVTSQNSFDGKFYQATDEGLRMLQEYRGFKSRLFEP
jgi:predicted glycosyltransferase/predicted transcriptional regulator